MTESRCRPARLLRFEETLGAVTDGVRRRAGNLADALDAYQARCAPPYRVGAVADADRMVRSWAAGARELGEWTGDVGRGFLAADAVDAFVTGRHERLVPSIEGVRSIDDRALLASLSDWADPYRGVAEGAAGRLAADLGLSDDQSAPPAWHRHLQTGGSLTAIAGSLAEGIAETLDEGVHVRARVALGAAVAFDDGTILTAALRAEIDARLRLPSASASRLTTAARWTSRASHALTFMTSARDQWADDVYLDDSERLRRAITRGAVVTLFGGFAGFGAGALAGVTVSPICGPFAPVCTGAFAIGGGMVGAISGNMAVDSLAGMDVDDDMKRQRRESFIRTELASDGRVDAHPALSASVDILTSAVVVSAVESEPPAFRQDAVSLLPDRYRLNAAASGSNASSTTTTRTTLPSPRWQQAMSDDPWPSRRSYE